MIAKISLPFACRIFTLPLLLLLAALPTQAANTTALANLPVTDRIKSCNPDIAIPAAREILDNPESLKEPISLFAPVQTLYQHGQKDEAVFWYYAAQLRVRYQLVFENGDRGQLMMVMMMTTGQLINNYALQDITRFTRILDRVLEWDAKTSNPYREKPQTEKSRSQIEKIYDSYQELKKRLLTDKENNETQARKVSAQIEQLYTGTFRSQCQSGQIDPAFEAQEIQKEWASAIQFAKSHPDVIRAVDKAKDAYAVASTRDSNKSFMPSRYEVAVKGESGISVFALVDVSRTGSQTSFSLACTTSLPMGNREVGKNVCTPGNSTNASTPSTNQTATYSFAATTWRSPSNYNDTIEFRESGTVAFKTSRGYSYGQWKIGDGILRFDNNNYSHYEATIDGDWLLVKARNGGNNWTTKWYRTDNEKIDKEIRKDIEASIKELNEMLESRRLSILDESPEMEQALQAGKGEQYGGKHWLSLCDEPTLRMKTMNAALPSGKSQSELCYNWYGTRHEWKETILKEGCRSRCRP